MPKEKEEINNSASISPKTTNGRHNSIPYWVWGLRPFFFVVFIECILFVLESIPVLNKMSIFDIPKF